MSDALHVHDLSVAYDRDVVLREVHLRLAPGESVALIGPNGAGKSTFIKAILGLVPATSGWVEVLGSAPQDARARVAYVPQVDLLDPQFPVTVFQVALMGRYRRVGWFRRPNAVDRAAARDALAEVGLADRADDTFGVLSGGQRQRVLIARAIAQEAELLLLDEPFNGVDAVTQDVLIDVLGRLRAAGTAVVMATHDISVAHLACGHACLLNRRQVAFGPLEQALTAGTLKETYGEHAVVLAEGTAFVNTH
ncbi:MAG TPA: metal ABC transporter ATP-binding protein [Acidimicrobiales bacterium]|jgi:manganese/iron transport system ATP-binding protein|nr:metal ABC transporter ATP-binding protein [Acidimicrobiales bacterium]